MTYKNGYAMLNQAGKIDEIINGECGKGESLNLVKMDIITAIKYYIDFTKDSAFRKMGYWQDDRFLTTSDERRLRRVTNAVCRALAEIEIANNNLYTQQLQYMISVQR